MWPIQSKSWTKLTCLLLLVAFVGCETAMQQGEKPDEVKASHSQAKAMSADMAKALVQFNQGAALLEQYKYAEAAKSLEGVLAAAPDWSAARFNLGLAYLNMQENPGASDSLELAKKAFEEVLAADANHLSARFCQGLYYQHLAMNVEALACFEAVSKADSQDPHVLYKVAETLISLDRAPEAITQLEKVIAIDPGFVSAVYRLAIQYQRARQREKAKPLFERFKALKNSELTGGTFTVLKSYGAVGKYYMALDAGNVPLAPIPSAATPRLLFSPELTYLSRETSVWKHANGQVSMPGLAAGDVDGDGDMDLCVTSMGPNASTALWCNDGHGVFALKADLSDHGVSPCFGDVDNDGDLDLWLGRVGEDHYLENQGQGQFVPVQGLDVSGGSLVTHCARLVDLDSDGDLDLLAMRNKRGDVGPGSVFEPAHASVHNNNRDGSFENLADKLGLAFKGLSIATALCDDLDDDRDLDVVIFPTGTEKPIGWVNDRVWQHHLLEAESMGLMTSHVLSATSGDPDRDGDRDLLIFTESGVQLFLNQGAFQFTLDQRFSDRCARLRGTGGQFADMDNDGDLDIVIADAHRRDGSRGPALLVNDRGEFTDVMDMDPGNLLGTLSFKGNASCVVGDFTGDGTCDIMLAPMGTRPFLIRNVTAGGHWIEIDLAGLRTQDKKSRSNNSAIGARIDIKTGTLCQQHVVGIPSGQLAMPAHRIHVGLGPYAKVDWLRIIWPDAILQAELELPADQVIEITELQRKTSSCPHLFVWDGTHFQFVSDFGGMGGMGYLVSPGQYAPPDPTEYLSLPDLEPLDGHYVLQALEPIEEVVYFDEATLMAVDHPVGTQVYPHEMMAVNSDPPPFELFCVTDAIVPVKAVDHQGQDVTQELLEIDRLYAGATELDHRFVGMAKDHFVDIDFGEGLQDISADTRLVLFASGWVEYGYSSTNFAASQAGVTLSAPTIEVWRAGQWVELFKEVGYPAGIRHTMTLDMTGHVFPTDSRLRLSTNMELYWDQIFISAVSTESGLQVTEASASHADLHFLGSPREYSPDGRLPLLYDYGSVDRTTPWKMMAGMYTRYGEVTDLLTGADDRYVVMGPGEELTLRFPAHAFGPVPNGYRRSFIFKSDSYCKDMDLYSAYPETVEPLPFHGMSTYPYPEAEAYPDDSEHNQYREQFNTRRILRSDN